MIPVNEALTRKVAELARLELSDTELQTFTLQLGDILKYVDLLSELDTSRVEPLTHPLELEAPLRADEVRPSPVDERGLPKMLRAAPETQDLGFKVPPIL